MRRADRLFAIVQLLRGGRHVTARSLAERLEVSERTIYRDIDELTLCGVPVIAEAGRGYALPPSFEIPPLMFERHEIVALVAGARFVEAWCGPELAASARSALARIRGVVPPALLTQIDDTRVFAPRFTKRRDTWPFEIVHTAIGERRRLHVRYTTTDDRVSERVIRPLGLYFWGNVWTIAAWCEMRDGFRNFRLDRIADPHLGDLFPDDPDKSLERFLEHVRAADGG